ncbi:hypothetical protein CYMTET_20350 [Cymbomonas tetramitiformis]|uniref:Uncharacterized protein n=1 Tax=Cymbomonas tetramitiformis TaxID=36881 RepID=A0AAE0L498_9CHLO|nr:hypothetical protein CYMTET_20350 [Cymbomonas tetramitiformis]
MLELIGFGSLSRADPLELIGSGAHRAMFTNQYCKSQGDEWMDRLTYKVFFDVSFQQCDYFAYRDTECVKIARGSA